MIFGYFLKNKNSKAFTIVELLVAIVVIGILAAITTVSYSGISQKARIVSLRSDLSNAITQLEIDKVYNSMYPINIADSNNGIGLKTSPGNTFEYEYLSGDYCLKATNNDVSYYVMSSEKVVTPGSCPVVRNLSAGYDHNCAINVAGNAFCWGWNGVGVIGDNSIINKTSPTAVNTTGVLSGLKIKAISAGFYHTCVIASDDNAYCWGWNNDGQLGNGSVTQSLVPVAVNRSGLLNGLKIKAISTGYNFTCAIASDDNAYCWGWNGNGTLGNDTITASPVPLPVAVHKTGSLSGLTVKAITTGFTHACLIASNNRSYCWGANDKGQLGDNTSVGKFSPTLVNDNNELSGLTIKNIDAGGKYTCAIASNEKAYCWGLSESGVLGDGNVNQHNNLRPTAVSTTGVLNGLSIKYISTATANSTQLHTCAIASNNKAYCWGYNGSGELGDNTNNSNAFPVEVYSTGALNGVLLKSIEVNPSGGTCALDSTNKVFCWGVGTNGELGRGSITPSIVPVVADPF